MLFAHLGSARHATRYIQWSNVLVHYQMRNLWVLRRGLGGDILGAYRRSAKMLLQGLEGGWNLCINRLQSYLLVGTREMV